MTVSIATTLLASLAIYGLIGLVFGIAFVTLGAPKLDSAAEGAPIHLRLLWLPGAIALWPVLLIKWFGAKP